MKRNATQPYKPGFFDKKGEIPKSVFGYETPVARHFLRTLGSTALNGRSIYKNNLAFEVAMAAKYHTNDVLRVVPLVEKAINSGITSQDVAEHRYELKKLAKQHSAALRWADRGCKLLSIIGIGIPIRMALNRKFDQTVAEKLPGILHSAQAYVPSIDAKVEPYFDMIEKMKGSPRELIGRDAAKVVEMVQSQSGKDPGLKRIGSALRTTSETLYSQPSLLESHSLAYENLGVSLLQKPVGIPDIAFELIAPTLIGELGECLPDGHRSKQFCQRVSTMHHPASGVADFSSRYTLAKSKIHQVGSLARLVPDDPHTPRRIYMDIRSHILAS